MSRFEVRLDAEPLLIGGPRDDEHEVLNAFDLAWTVDEGVHRLVHVRPGWMKNAARFVPTW
ncbi:hypothetical protein [Rhodococcus koreensis]|uniref:hypothetical protein n=1 Tax=Rhodococcus koreensis TaxID=99653 RepID=UPI00115FBD18|nr:hypothetical protein [Rhodococcus koreensis]